MEIVNNTPNIVASEKKEYSILSLFKVIFEKIFPLILVGILAVRLFCYQSQIDNFIGLSSSPISKSQTILALLAIWLQYTVVVLTIIRAFFNIKTVNNIIRFISIPSFIFNIVMLNPILLLLQGVTSSKILYPFILTFWIFIIP